MSCHCCQSRTSLILDKKTGREYCSECAQAILEAYTDEEVVDSTLPHIGMIFGRKKEKKDANGV